MSVNSKLFKSIKPLSLALAFALASSLSHAANTHVAAQLIETTGVGPHLGGVSSAVYEGALAKQLQCYSNSDEHLTEEAKTDLKNAIEEHLGASITVERAVSVLNRSMVPADLEAVAQFFKSPVGARIVAAETASKDFDEQRFYQLMDETLNSTSWDDTRIQLVEGVYESTRAAGFVSILNGEILVASTLSGYCDNTNAGFDKLLPHLAELRSTAQLLEPIMKGDIVKGMATVFKDLPNSDLLTYIEFAQSEVGTEFFDALLSSTAISISDALPGLRESLLR